jgi:hypothetical protein
LRRLAPVATEVIDGAPAEFSCRRRALPFEAGVLVERRVRAIVDRVELCAEELIANAGLQVGTVTLKVLLREIAPVGAAASGQSEGQQNRSDREQNRFRSMQLHSFTSYIRSKQAAGLPISIGPHP